MGIEVPKNLTEKQKGETKRRIISDAELIKGGAGIKDDGSIDVTEDQIRNIKLTNERGRYLEDEDILKIEARQEKEREEKRLKHEDSMRIILSHETPEDREFDKQMKEVDDIDFDEE